MNPQPDGPLIDWLAGLLAGLWQMLRDLYQKAADAAARLEARIDHAEWVGLGLFGCLVAAVLLHAWITKQPRKA